MKTLERILLWNILPIEWSFETLILVEDIRKKIEFTTEQIEEIGLKTLENWQITWDDKNEKDVEIKFSEAEKNLIKEELKKLSETKKLKANMITLYKLFN